MPDWNEIVQDNARNVANAAYRVLGNMADAEDVSQEVFAEAYQKWDPESGQQWAGLLRRLAVCRAIDLLRRKKESVSLPSTIPDNSESEPIDVVSTSEMQTRLREAIASLPTRQAEVFCLVYFEQHSNETVAEMLGISRPAVATALSKARSKLELVFRAITTGEIR